MPKIKKLKKRSESKLPMKKMSLPPENVSSNRADTEMKKLMNASESPRMKVKK